MFAKDQRPRGNLYKVAILGDGGVGKTALTIQLCLNQFVETYDPTIEDSYRKKILLDNEPVTLEVLDTAGQEEYTSLRDQWIREGEGFLLVYSITSRSTFTRISQYYEQITRVKDGEPFSAVLVANKCDRNDERSVSSNEGKQLAQDLDIPFFETSAKLNINAEAAFTSCARITKQIRSREDQPEAGESGAGGAPGGAPATGAATGAAPAPGTAPGTAPAPAASPAPASSTKESRRESRKERRREKGKKDKKCLVM